MNNEHIENVYELTPLQQGMLFHSLRDTGANLYFEQSSMPLLGAIDVEAFRRAWQYVVDRHTVLRSSFHWEGVSKPLQVVSRTAVLPFDHQDWRGLSAAEQGQRLESYLAADRARGFELEHPPLMRIGLMQLGPERHQFVMSMHHALVDGWSKGVLSRDVFAAYGAYMRGREPELPAVRPYSDYIAWLQRQDLSRSNDFWRQRLGDFKVPTDLRLGEPAPAVAASSRAAVYGECQRHCSPAATSSLGALARQLQLTVNTVLLGAWGLLLSRYSDRDDVVFGSVVSGRPAELPGIESMVGLFINTLPLRVSVNPETSLPVYLRALQAQQAELREHECSSLAEVQALSGVPRGTPLFDTLVVYENYPGAEVGNPAGAPPADAFTHSFERTNYPLTLIAVPGEQLMLQAIFDTARFDAPAIDRLLGHLQNLLAGMVAQPQARLDKLPLLGSAERQQLLVGWNSTQADRPELCLHELVRAQAARTPAAAAVVMGEQQLSYRALDARANQLAHGLRAHGVGPESRVGLCMERSLDMAVSLLGILKAGAAYVPLDPQYPQQRLRFMLNDAGIALLLTQTSLLPRLPETSARIVCIDREGPQLNVECDSGPPPDGATPESLAYIIYTSGSTGMPKGVAMPHAPLVNLVTWQIQQTRSDRAGLRTAQLAPLSFDVSCQEIFSAWCAGGTLVLVPESLRREPSQLITQLAQQRVQRLFIPFVGLQQLADAAMLDTRHLPMPDLQEVITAGEQLKVTASIVALFNRLPNCSLINQYGPSETHVVTSCRLRGDPSSWPALPPIGRPIANTRIYLLDSHKQPVPAGVAAELYVGGEALARGYLDRPAVTAQRFVTASFHNEPGQRLYRTGDIARYLPDGNLQFLGRADDQVKIRGHRVEPGEVEVALGRHPAIRECAVVAQQDSNGETRLAAYLVAPEHSDPAMFREHLKALLPDHLVPAWWTLLEQLPTTPSGKVDRQALPKGRDNSARPGPGFKAPETAVEALLCKLWSEVLDRTPIGIHDNFFELGGHSLLATRLVSRVRSTFELELPIGSLFSAPTVAGLAATIEDMLLDELERETEDAAANAHQPPLAALQGVERA